MNLAENLLSSARERPGSTAVRLGTTTFTYAELDRLTQLVAGFLSRPGGRAGDRVGVMLPNVRSLPGCTTGSCGPERWWCR